jgi:hypothetical protein
MAVSGQLHDPAALAPDITEEPPINSSNFAEGLKNTDEKLISVPK